MTITPALGSIGQISRTVSDVPRAVAWYRDILGLRHLYTFGDLAFFADPDGGLLALMSQVAPDDSTS